MVCDNDLIAEKGEPCDGTDLQGKTCVDFGFTGGTLRCTESCEFNTSRCELFVCDNDGEREFGEACDCGASSCSGPQLDGRSCLDFDDYDGGELKCSDQCDFVTDFCFICNNNNIAENGEACDGTDIRGRKCQDFVGYFDD